MILNRVIVRRELLWLTIFFFLIKALSPYLVEYMIVGCICRIIRFLGDRFHISLLFMCVHDNLFLLKSSVGLLHLGNEISWIQYEDISYKNTWLAMSPYYAILFLSVFLGLFGLSSFFSCTTLGTENPLFFFFHKDHFLSTSEYVSGCHCEHAGLSGNMLWQDRHFVWLIIFCMLSGMAWCFEWDFNKIHFKL